MYKYHYSLPKRKPWLFREWQPDRIFYTKKALVVLGVVCLTIALALILSFAGTTSDIIY